MTLLRSCVITGAALFTAACGPSLPSDAEMIASFTENRAAFERVRTVMLQTEGIERVEEGGADLLPLPTSQRDEIASLMTKAGVALIRVTKGGAGDQWVEFTFHRSGFAFGGALKDLTWSNRKPTPPILDSLDDPTDRRGFVTKTWFRASRPLEDGWYLSLSKD